MYNDLGDAFDIVLIGFLKQGRCLPCSCSCLVLVYVKSLSVCISLCLIWFPLAYSVLLIGSSFASACSSLEFLLYGYFSL